MKLKIKKMISMYLTLIFIFGIVFAIPFSASAYSCSYTSYGDFEYTIEVNNIHDGTTWIHSYLGDDTEITIPEEIDGYKVVGIWEDAFRGCTDITDIKIPDSVYKIGDNAFDDTKWYRNIYADSPDGIIYINNVAYEYKGEIAENATITLKNGTTGIGGGAFLGISEKLVGINIPNTLKYIGIEAFRDCYNLKSISIPDGVTEIDGFAFDWCTSLTNIEIPDSVKYIGEEAFSECSGLKNVTLGNGIKKLENNIFYDCTSLVNIKIPDSVICIDREAFYDCDKLENIILSDSVVEIDSTSFKNTQWYKNQPPGMAYIGNYLYAYKGTIEDNTSVAIKDGTIGIADGVFKNSTNLSVTIPESVISIADNTFKDCENLTINGYKNTKAEIYANKNNINFNSIGDYVKNCEFYYRVLNDNTAEITRCIGTDADVIIPSEIGGYTVSSIGDYAFIGCPMLKTVSIPNSINNIGSYPFKDCVYLTDIFFDGTSEMWDNILTTDIYNVTIHFNSDYDPKWWGNINWNIDKNGTLLISGNGFINPYEAGIEDEIPWYNERESIKNVVIEEGIEGIGNYTFMNCKNLKTISIPSSVNYVGVFSFYKDDNLETINVNKNNQNYTSSDGVLFTKSMDTVVKCPNGKVGSYTLPSTVKSIGNHSFRECSKLTSVKLHDKLTSIGYGAFYDCAKLLSITVPKSVTSIDFHALGFVFHKGGDTPISNFKIQGYPGTTAEKYAKENSIKFVDLSAVKTSQKVTGVKSQYVTSAGKTFNLNAKAKTKLTYTSSNKNVAVVSSTGKVTVKAGGYAYITVKASENGNYKSAYVKTKIISAPRNFTSKDVSKVKKTSTTKAKITWKSLSGATGYTVQLATNKSYKGAKTVKNSKNKATLTKLKKGKTYYVRISAYTKVSGKNYANKWYTVKFKM